MGGISFEIATEIKKYLAGNQGIESDKKIIYNEGDPRFTIIDMLIDFPDIEKVLHDSIKEVVIDYFDPNYNIYGASIMLDENYTLAKGRVMMIPSHAILLALLANRNVYVKKQLVDGQSFEDDGYETDDIDSKIDPYEESDDWDDEY
jgi:bifunctional DNase/RNase